MGLSLHPRAHGAPDETSDQAIRDSGVHRAAAFFAGCTALAATSSATITAGHLSGPDAATVAALAGAVAIGSTIVARAPRGMAIVIVMALLAGEANNLLSTAERIVSQRSDASAKIAAGNATRMAAEARLAAAVSALAAHRANAVATVATPSCRTECRALLQSQEAALASEVDVARFAADKAQPVQSQSPLADRLGWSPWVLDLVSAGLLSFGANVLAAVLIGWASRPSGPVQKRIENTSTVVPSAGRSREVAILARVATGAAALALPASASASPVAALVSVDGRTAGADTTRTPRGHPRTPNKHGVSGVSAISRTPLAGHPRTPRQIVTSDSVANDAISGWVGRLAVDKPTALSLRALARDIGSSHQQAGRALANLAAAGAVKVEASRNGTTVTRLA